MAAFLLIFCSFYLRSASRDTGKDLKTEQIAQWKSPWALVCCLCPHKRGLSWPDHVCPDPQTVPSPSGTQAMCFGGKPHKRDLAGGRTFQKKPWPLRANTPARNPSGCGENVILPKGKSRENLKANESSKTRLGCATLWAESVNRDPCCSCGDLSFDLLSYAYHLSF